MLFRRQNQQCIYAYKFEERNSKDSSLAKEAKDLEFAKYVTNADFLSIIK